MMENIPFFISPPYQVLMITCIFWVRLKATQVSELMPSSFQFSTFALEAFITTKSGVKLSSSSLVGRTNMLVTKWACHATSMMKRTARRVSLLVPQKASTT